MKTPAGRVATLREHHTRDTFMDFVLVVSLAYELR